MVCFSNGMKESQFPTIDKWDLVYYKGELLRIKW